MSDHPASACSMLELPLCALKDLPFPFCSVSMYRQRPYQVLYYIESEARNFLFSTTFRVALAPTRPSIQCIQRIISLRGNASAASRPYPVQILSMGDIMPHILRMSSWCGGVSSGTTLLPYLQNINHDPVASKTQ